MKTIGCPTRYRTRHFFNFTTNEDIATKFEADLLHCVRSVTTSKHVLEVATILLLLIIKEMPGSVASGTHCISMYSNSQTRASHMFICRFHCSSIIQVN
jgi:hypothetical protein